MAVLDENRVVTGVTRFSCCKHIMGQEFSVGVRATLLVRHSTSNKSKNGREKKDSTGMATRVLENGVSEVSV